MTRFAAALLLLAACSAGPDDPDAGTRAPVTVADCLARPECRRPLVVAHSANIVFAPGNSPASYDASLSHGADVLETDVRLTADKVPVLLHDDELKTVFSDCEGLVSQKTWAEISGCTFKVDKTGLFIQYDPKTLPPQHPLTLEALLERVDGRAIVAAEIKNDPENAALSVVRNRGWLDRVIFLVSESELSTLREASTDAWVILRTKSAEDVDEAVAANDPKVVVFHGDEDWTTEDVLARAHAAGRKVWINVFSNPGLALREWEGEELCTPFWDDGFDLVQTNRADLCVEAARAR